ncbi:hypothetical protein FACS1894172_08440 [Spirochaetia bacterium]|nr:hypothetical protein FACS1894164_13900 [Spirochaetia bacterium]GHU32220.1 hypothetical protein FACS1894172_08440 [Spirochaetia bacterium]
MLGVWTFVMPAADVRVNVMFSVLEASRSVEGNIVCYASLVSALSAATGTSGSPDTIRVYKDIPLSSVVSIPAGKHIELTSSIGNSIWTLKRGATTTGDLFTVASGASLTLSTLIIDGDKNTVADAGGSLVKNSGIFTMNDGATLQNNKTTTSGDSGGGVYNSGAFDMDGGAISGNSADGGGGVYNSGTFTMNDGTISENEASMFGGGVYNDGTGTFTMNDGSITGNSADDGGGVSNAGNFRMYNGSITKNEASSMYGGGVYNSGTGTFTMNDGTISENKVTGTTSGQGGGVYISDGTFDMNRGTISKNEVTATNGQGGGVHIAAGTFTMNGGTIYGTNAVADANIANTGVAISVNSGTAQYGNFSTISTSDNTITP